MDLEKYSREELIAGLTRLQKEYPCVFIHFFMSNIDPIWYDQFIRDLGTDRDPRKHTKGLGQEQEADSGQT